MSISPLAGTGGEQRPATLAEMAAAIRSGKTTSVAAVEQSIAAADKYDEAVGMFLARFNEQALEAATAADEALEAGKPVGTLHGVPLGIKDIFGTTEGPTTAQSLVHDPQVLQGDAAAVQRLRQAGGIIMGKLTTMEFATGEPDPTKPFPVPRSSWSLKHWAGGSSSGSGSSVSLGAAYGALGSDTGGSIRIPAAYCGISGLMPTYGRVPKSGTVPLGFTVDHVGPMARSAQDCALMLDVLAGPDASDPTASDVPVGQYAAGLTGDLAGVRIGVDRMENVTDEYDAALSPAFDAALEVFAKLGADIVEVKIPHYAEMTTVDEILMYGEALTYHLPDMQRRWKDYGLATRLAIGTALFYSATDYVQAQRARRVGQKAIKETFKHVDLILMPTAGGGAAALERMEKGYFHGFGPIYTAYWDTLGNPVLGIPFGFTDEQLPLGLQIAGRPFEEELILRAGDAFQRLTDWHLRVPDPLAQVVAAPAPKL
ncbi:amidase [Arthrobacter globiformis]|uniref:amidase n=1 Tax=Arthrobacter globiformis TaxID=1665 RepID=UPI002792EA74|nr:amidase [Arthrobacter globiformis]MDQ0618239.1 aspartyl-tRNA(Asn)/glutamyl-tRNA(Gln) amidotransferase subunit A [Arthrobacter globiformis]